MKPLDTEKLFAPKICPSCKVLKNVIVFKDYNGWFFQCRDCGGQFRIDNDKSNPLTFQKRGDYEEKNQ